MEEGFSVSDGSSMSRASLTFIDVGWDLFCLGFSVIFRDFVMISHKLAKASRLGGRLVSSSNSSVSPLPSLLIKPAAFSRLSISWLVLSLICRNWAQLASNLNIRDSQFFDFDGGGPCEDVESWSSVFIIGDIYGCSLVSSVFTWFSRLDNCFERWVSFMENVQSVSNCKVRVISDIFSSSV